MFPFRCRGSVKQKAAREFARAESRRSGGSCLIVMNLEDGCRAVVECAALRELQVSLLSDALRALALGVKARLVVDMSRVITFCASWITVLIDINARCVKRGVTFVLTGLNHQCEHMLRQFGMHKQFKIVRTGCAA
jgi:anti-anti-sigma regulatory factor